jgi:hypothetical protein
MLDSSLDDDQIFCVRCAPQSLRSSRREENPNPETGRHETNEQGRGQLVPVSLAGARSDVGTGRPHPVRWQALEIFGKTSEPPYVGCYERLSLMVD